MVENGPSTREMDYLVQTNFVSFFVLWRSKEYHTCQKYIAESKKYIYAMINNTELQQDPKESEKRTSEGKNNIDSMFDSATYPELLDYLMQSDTE